MKKTVFPVAAILLLIGAGLFLFYPEKQKPETEVFVPLTSSDKDSEEYRRTGIIARSDWGYPPFEYLNEAGEPEGFNIDILRRIAEIMNLDIRINLGPWEEVRKEIERGEIDILAGMYKTEERAKQVDFSIPHFLASYGVFVPERSQIVNLKDLEGSRILVQTGDLAHDYLIEQEIGEEIVTVDEWEALLPELRAGRADCAVMGMVQGVQLLQERGYDEIRVLSQPLLQRPYSIAVKKGDAELLAFINEGLNLLKTSGEYDRIYEKWFGVYEYGSSPDPLVKIFAVGMLILAAVLLLSMLWSYSLKKQVKKQTAKLTSAMEELSRANSIKSRFLAGVSHELRTPLNGIIGMSELMEKTGLDSRQKELLNMIQTASSQLFRVISDLLDVSRIESGQLSLTKAPFRIDETAEWVEPVLRKSAEEKGLSFYFTASCDGSSCRGVVLNSDKERIAQILMNLADNAVKYTEAGEVEVHLGYSKEREELTIRVKDTGRGISAEQQEKVFEPFKQLRSSPEEVSSGLGLGLSLVKSIVDLMGGTIDLKSTPGEGTVCTVILPVKEAEETAEPEEHTPLPQSLFEGKEKSKQVLLAEDEAINRLYLERTLSAMGWTTDSVSNGEEALRVFGEREYDLILMDLTMPKVTGLDASRRIRAIEKEKGLRRTPIIALTAHAYEQNKIMCLEAGMDGFVSKPYHEQTLWEEIQRLLL
ncbi:MAG: transporter substrate-binding domain-containing protein [Spirochaetaceae bacterium]